MRLHPIILLLLPTLVSSHPEITAPIIPGYTAFTTIYPPPSTPPSTSTPQTPSNPIPQPTPEKAPSTNENQPPPHHLDLRSPNPDPNPNPDPEPNPAPQNAALGGAGPAAARPVVPNQVSPITTVYIGSVQVVYTQLFAAVPDQGPTAASGTIGLGTLTGQVGVVKTAAAKSAAGGRGNGRGGLGVGVGVGVGIGVAMGMGGMFT